MNEVELLQSVDTKLGKIAGLSDVIDSKFKEFDSKLVKYRVDGGPEKTGELAAGKEKAVAEMGELGMLDSLAKFEIWNVPLGEAAVGGFVAVLATELIDGFMTTQSVQTKGLVKLVTAGAVAGFGKKYLGANASKAIALLMAFDAIRDLTPIDAWAASLATKITGAAPDAGLADKAMRRITSQPPHTISDYYAAAEGRR
jgi:hypothetical protein